jgi:histidinol-phosphate aminotransferase
VKEGLDPARFVRPELRALPAYTLDLSPSLHKLDQNEVPWDLPASAKRRALSELAATNWARYPDFHSDALRERLGALHGWPAQGILVGNGANELLDLTLQAIVPRGGEVLSIAPGFGLYPLMVTRAGGTLRSLPCDADLRLPKSELLSEVESAPNRPLLLCSPNNPTGEAFSPDEVDALASRLEAPLLLDNAYGEFSRHDYRPLLKRHPHLVLFRTFSKAWSLAGLRIGYLMADPRLVVELQKTKLPYNLGHPAQCAALAALDSAAAAERRVRLLIARRAQWADMLTNAGLDPLPSEANFLLVRCGSPERAAAVRDGLALRGIRVRALSGAALGECLRVSVGRGDALRATRAALAEIAAGTAASPWKVTPRRTVGPGQSVENAPKERKARIERATGETSVAATLELDGGSRTIDVPNGFLGHLLTALGTHAGWGLEIAARGDVHVDLHHTVEDVGIVLGDALSRALGERRGIVRFGSAFAPLDEALAHAVVDLGGRSYFTYTVPPELAACWVTAEFPLSLVGDFFQAFADRGRLNLHLEIRAAGNGHHAAEAAFKAVALALRQAISLRDHEMPSTKGTLTG